VAFPEDVLAEEEEVVLHLHPHWKTAIRPALVLLVALAATVTAWVMLPTTDAGRAGVVTVAAAGLFLGVTRGVWPLAVWRCRHYVFTDERILLQEGVLARDRRDLPLSQVNDHVLSQSLTDRMFGCGTLRIDSIGDQIAELAAVPRAHEVQTTLYELIETDRELHADDEDEEEEELEPPPRRRFGLGRRDRG
jgi:uncharacterized membrane protein YdbT with pleckstrin-like domain